MCVCVCVCACVWVAGWLVWVGVGGCRCLCVGVCVSIGVTMIVSKFVSTKSLENRIYNIDRKIQEPLSKPTRCILQMSETFTHILCNFDIESVLYFDRVFYIAQLPGDFHRKPVCGVMTFIVACSFLCFYTFSVNHFLHYMNFIFLLHSDNSVFFFGIDESAISSNLSHWFSIST